MSVTRSAPAPAASAASRVSASAPAPAPGGLWAAWNRFWFAPASPLGLHVLRKLAGLLFLAWLLPFAGQVEALYGLGGWFDQQAYLEASRLPGGPPRPLTWSVFYLAGTEPAALYAVYGVSLAVLVLFTLGVWPRLTAVLTFVVVASCTANPVVYYDAESLLLLFAFYLMVGYVFWGQGVRGLSWRERLLGPAWVRPAALATGKGAAEAARPDVARPDVARPSAARPDAARPSVAANAAVRLWQVHFALAVLACGLHKLQFGDWWSGVAFWYPLNPPFEATPESVRTWAPYPVAYLTVLSLAAYLTLAWQIGFPVFAWRPRWRVVLLGGAVLGWLGAVLVYGLPLFGPAFVLGCLAYLTPSEWERLAAWAGRLKTPVLRTVVQAVLS